MFSVGCLFCGDNMYSNIRFLEDRLSKLVGKDITVKRKSFYIDEQFSSFAKFLVDEEETGIEVDFYDLTEYDKRGRLNHELARLAEKIKEIL